MAEQLAWLTPDEIPTTDFICRRLRIPNNPDVIAQVNGAILSLCEAFNWEENGVGISVTVDAMMIMFDEYLESDACMIGAILPYATTDAPNGCLPCDGSTHNRIEYPRLYERLDPLYQVDADTFVTPDLRGRAIISEGEGTGLTVRALGDTGGVEVHELTTDEMPEHAHTTQPHTHTNVPHGHLVDVPLTGIDLEGAGVPDITAVGNPPFPRPTTNVSITIDNATVTVDSAGGGEAHENMPPFYVLRYCIVAR